MKRSVAIIGMALLCAVGFFGLNKLNEPKPFDPDSIPDVVEYLTGVPGDTVIATVDGQPVAAGEYLFWAGYAAEEREYYYGEIDWAERVEGETLLDYVKKSALEACKLYRIIKTKADEMGCGFTEENGAALQAEYDAMAEQLGGETEMKKWLLQIGLTDAGFKKVYQPPYLYNNILESITEVTPATAEEMADYIAENDVLKAKHILLMAIDPKTYEPLDEEQQAAKKQRAEELLQQLRESEEPLELFDQLMKENSEDGGLAANPDGYLFTGSSNFVTAFKDTTRALEYDQISDVVESEYGYHIILRLDPADEAFAADLGRLLGETRAQEEMDALVSDWMAEAKVETNETYDSLDIPAYYANLKALREEIAAVDAAAAEAAA